MSSGIVVQLAGRPGAQPACFKEALEHCQRHTYKDVAVLHISNLGMMGQATASHVSIWERALALMINRVAPSLVVIQGLHTVIAARQIKVMRLHQKKHHKRYLAQRSHDSEGQQVRQWFQLEQTGFTAFGAEAIHLAMREFFKQLSRDIATSRAAQPPRPTRGIPHRPRVAKQCSIESRPRRHIYQPGKYLALVKG